MFEELANEEFFPGNLQALETLHDELARERLIAFVGSGISVPLAPTWGGLLSGLIDAGLSDGFILEQDELLLRQQISDDPLELASTLEEAFTPARFRPRLGASFRLDDQCTAAHQSLVGLPLQGIFTLNYDDGLSTAYVRRFQRMPAVIRSDDRFELHRWSLDRKDHDAPYPIIHWHGTANAPEKMILTSDDYDLYYGNNENRSFIEELWRGRRLLLVGFGFRDPILTRLAETVLRTAAGDNQHIAIIGRREVEPMTPLLRRTFSKKYRVNPIFYKIHVDEGGAEDHSDMLKILEAAASASANARSAPKSASVTTLTTRESAQAAADREFKDGLFVGPNGQALYVEPRILSSMSAHEDGALEQTSITVQTVAQQTNHTIISVPLEAGGTTLARRLVFEIIAGGDHAIYRESSKIGSYKKKILEDHSFRPDNSLRAKRNVLIIDNFDANRDGRMIKEVVGLKYFDRIIVITRARGDDVTNLDDLDLNEKFETLALQYLDRSDVRNLATQLYDTFDGDLISAAVEKTYSDLLDLCIPLTPSNVIMYLSVIHREGSFTPLNRLHIMDRFIRDMLHRPGDLYRDSFNADNKLDVISAFIYELFMANKPSFSKTEWISFCDAEMKDSLIWFDKDTLFEDLQQSRLIVSTGNEFTLKYKLFYSYFVGKFVAERPKILSEFLAEGRHLAIDSLVEIIAGSSKDNTILVADLVDRLEASIHNFEDQYDILDFDPYKGVEWRSAYDEKTKLWNPVIAKLSEGPASNSEVDKLKRSIIAESRTADQNVIIRELSGYQKSVSYLQYELISALLNSQKLDRDLKSRGMNAIYQGYRIAMQIGFLFSPIIATRRFFVWNDYAFYNHMNWPGYADADVERKADLIAGSVPRAIVNKAADDLGSKKLGAVFEHMALDSKPSDFNTLLTFALVIRSKPAGWEMTAKKILEVADRKSIYLRYMLASSIRQFNQEVNTSADRASLKRVVAHIQAKRDVKKTNPNSKMIDSTLRRLELQKFFEKTKKAYFDANSANVPAIEAEAQNLLEPHPIGLVAEENNLDPQASAISKKIGDD